MEVIGKVENKEMLALLELQFLCYKTGEEIADLLGYSVDNVFKKRRKTLEQIKL